MITREEIAERLAMLESQENLKILFACESGSRAWGFPSPNSDYDVRFIYVRPLRDYVRLQPLRDTVEGFWDENEFDYGGWDISKTLKLFMACNTSLYEWLGSPIVYCENGPFAETLRQAVAVWFKPVRSIHHYFNLVRNLASPLLNGEQYSVKKFFCIIRPLLCCHWIDLYKTMPPTEIFQMLEVPGIPTAARDDVLTLVETKRQMKEREQLVVSEQLQRFVRVLYDQMSVATAQSIDTYPHGDHVPRESMEELFWNTVRTMEPFRDNL